MNFSDKDTTAADTTGNSAGTTQNHTGTTIIVVEDEAITAMLMRTTLSTLGFTVLDTFATGEDAVRAVLDQKPDVVLMDINLAGEMDGIEAAHQISRDTSNSSRIIFVTGYSDSHNYDRARALEPAGYLVKPVEFTELTRLIRESAA